jgi:2-polyprenyl-3-methyl-5-hydroxy-6-metoxy-1,4-benzoquinol methylase
MSFATADVSVTVLNLSAEQESGVRQVVGDARAMPQFGANEFDVVYSNSVIEHVGDRDDQRAVADEMRRVGKRYFVQTPNLWFPLEPHFLVPGFQFLPVRLRASLLARFDLGHIARRPGRAAAEETVRSIQLLSARSLREMFPEATLYKERFLGFTKSLMAAGGWGDGR